MSLTAFLFWMRIVLRQPFLALLFWIPSHEVKSLQLIWGSGTRKFHLRQVDMPCRLVIALLADFFQILTNIFLDEIYKTNITPWTGEIWMSILGTVLFLDKYTFHLMFLQDTFTDKSVQVLGTVLFLDMYTVRLMFLQDTLTDKLVQVLASKDGIVPMSCWTKTTSS